MAAPPITSYVITAHAAREMARRRLNDQILQSVLTAPEQRVIVRAGRDVLQSRFSCGANTKTYLVRVFVDVDRSPAEVVTLYKTSRVAGYWEAL